MKEKRRQKLNKAGYDARMRMKADRDAAKAREVCWRQTCMHIAVVLLLSGTNPSVGGGCAARSRTSIGQLRIVAGREEAGARGEWDRWSGDDTCRRPRLTRPGICMQNAIESAKERKKLKEQLGDRKSLAAQNRMKQITNMASEAPANKKKRKKGDNDDTFGADDDDWAVYREIVSAADKNSDEGESDGLLPQQREDDSEAEEDEQEQLQKVEEVLLKYDPNFTINDTAERKAIQKQLLLNGFVRGMAPGDPLDSYDSNSPEHAAQLHLSVERIRVPEVTYQPSLAGIDSAGLLEVIEHILKSFSPSERDRLTSVSQPACPCPELGVYGPV